MYIYIYILWCGILRGSFLTALTTQSAFFLRSNGIRRRCSTTICRARNIDSCRIEDWPSDGRGKPGPPCAS